MSLPRDANPEDLRIVIPSLGRVDTIKTAIDLFPHDRVIVVVNAHEEGLYRRHHPGITVLPHPPELRGLGQVRGWIWQTIPHDAVFMVDDDARGCWSNVGHHVRRIHEPAAVLGVVQQAARCAAEAGTCLFGFAHTPDVRNFKTTVPFAFTGYINGNAMGLIGRDPRVQFDPALRTKQDVDLSLQALLHYRILWRDQRYSIYGGGTFKHHGGNARFRTRAVVREDTAYLERKWGEAVAVNHDYWESNVRDSRGKRQRHVNIQVSVRRRQPGSGGQP